MFGQQTAADRDLLPVSHGLTTARVCKQLLINAPFRAYYYSYYYYYYYEQIFIYDVKH